MAKKNSTSGTPLSEVDGVGPARAKKLRKAGIKSAEGITQHKPETIAEKAGISVGNAENIVKAAEKVASKPKKAAKKTKRSSKRKTTKKKAAKKTTRKSKKTGSGKQAEDKAAKAAATAMRDIIARARDHFRKAPEQHVFHVADGRQLRDIKELAEALDDMADHVFSHHVNDDRHDFAAWVHEVLQERALAEQLRASGRDPSDHQHVIYRHIVRRVW